MSGRPCSLECTCKRHSQEGRPCPPDCQCRRHIGTPKSPESIQKRTETFLENHLSGIHLARGRKCLADCTCKRHSKSIESIEKVLRTKRERYPDGLHSTLGKVCPPSCQCKKHNRTSKGQPCPPGCTCRRHLNKGCPPGKHFRSPEAIQQALRTKQEHFPNGITYTRGNPTSIERSVQDVLKQHNISFEPEHQIRWYAIDIFVPDANLCIECDGSYWHSGEKSEQHDRRKDTFLRNHGYIVVRLKEEDIWKDVNALVEREVLPYLAEYGARE